MSVGVQQVGTDVCFVCALALFDVLQFSSIVGAITPTNLVLMWPLMVLSVLHVLLGVVPGTTHS
jgi:hypothetical protein